MIEQHVIKHGHEACDITPRMLRYWWTKLNTELFEGGLWVPQLSYGDDPTPGCGKAEVDGATFPLGGQRVRLHISNSITTRQAMLATLAHEMVHQYQYQNDLPMTHGETFLAWEAPIKLITGLTI